MNASHHADAILTQVVACRPWIADDTKRAGRSRYARIYVYRSNVSLQVLCCRSGGGTAEAIEAGLVFDDLSRAENQSNLEEYRQQLGENEQKLGLTLRDGEGGGHLYLSRYFPLDGAVEEVQDQAAKLCLAILDLILGGPRTRELYCHGREAYLAKHGGLP